MRKELLIGKLRRDLKGDSRRKANNVKRQELGFPVGGENEQRGYHQPFHGSIIPPIFKRSIPARKILQAIAFVAYGLLFLFVPFVISGPAPLHTDDPAVQENFDVIFNQMATHSHNGEGTINIENTDTDVTLENVTVENLTVTNALIVSTSIVSGAPTVDAIYSDLMPKAIGQITAAGAVDFGINVTSASRPTTGNYQVNFITNFASSTTYICMATRAGAGAAGEITIHTSSSNWTNHTAIFRVFDTATGAAQNNNFGFACFGDQ